MPGVGVSLTGGTTGVAAEIKAKPLPTCRLLLRGSYNFAEFLGKIEGDGQEIEAIEELGIARRF
jgi:hypothetical protein